MINTKHQPTKGKNNNSPKVLGISKKSVGVVLACMALLATSAEATPSLSDLIDGLQAGGKHISTKLRKAAKDIAEKVEKLPQNLEKIGVKLQYKLEDVGTTVTRALK